MYKKISISMLLSFLVAFSSTHLFAQKDQESVNRNAFRQMYQEFSTPNVYRSANGAPGHQYYQQKADYQMKIRIDDENQRLYGEETITYFNNSPDVLDYLWLQLDQNMRAKDSDTKKIASGRISDEKTTFSEIKRLHNDFDGGFKIEDVSDDLGNQINYTVNKTMMRIDLDKPLNPSDSYTFKIKWWYNINDRAKIGGRSGLEYFPEEDNYLYTIAQFFPRMCVYNDVEGWQNKQFLGRGEFTLTFGDYDVEITVPSDHLVSATGELQNASEVLTSAQQDRLKKAANATEDPVFIVTEAEAKANEKQKAKGEKTWHYKASNVRDFGFASSRKFIWDAMAVKFGDRTVMAMSMYPKEGNPLWERYSTRVVAHTLKVYSKYTFDYPYPVAWSIHTDRIGMEYPMICFNGGRPEADGTYSKRTKYGMIGVIIHEVGHNFFPMIVNSDERQWTWMDEGLNTFLQYLTEQEWERDYPSRRGPAYKIVDYMKGDKSNITPIMTNSESIYQFGNNAYGKPATALNILRETILGRELFDYAFKKYAQRWQFKHPTPEDLFRTMEDASGVDLDWFWRGWFYGTDHVDLAIEDMQWYKVDTRDPKVEKKAKKEFDEAQAEHIGVTRNREEIEETYAEQVPSMLDFYNKYDPYEISVLDEKEYEDFKKGLEDEDLAILNPDDNYYEVTFVNEGGLVMPIILQFEYTDGSSELMYIPAEIWRLNHKEVSKVFLSQKEIASITMDPNLETADVDLSDNHWPRKAIPTRFQIYKDENKKENLMQRDQRSKEMK
jgi:hypothetical protein